MDRKFFVTVSDKRFPLRGSVGTLGVLMQEFVDALPRIDPRDEDQVRELIQTGCTTVDKLLGKGAMEKISDGKPISLIKVISVLNAILSSVNAAFKR